MQIGEKCVSTYILLYGEMPIFHLIFQPAVYYSKNALLSAVSPVCLVKNSKVPFYPVTFMGNVQRLGVPFTNGSYTYKLLYTI